MVTLPAEAANPSDDVEPMDLGDEIGGRDQSVVHSHQVYNPTLVRVRFCSQSFSLADPPQQDYEFTILATCQFPLDLVMISGPG